VRSLQQAWEAAIKGIPVSEFAATHPELRAALDVFSS
jgi:ribulose 1,5-bisphosphate carboxylase large subunit-like protein